MELTISGYVSTAAPIAYPTTTTFQYALWESSPAYPISSVLVQNGFQWLNFTVVLTPGTYRFGTSTQVGTGVEPVVPLPVTAKVDAKLLMRIREVGLPETPSPFPTSDEERFEFLTQTVGPTPTAPDGDSDADGFPDAVDNCKLLTNLSQCDSDGDGFGNHCDADMNNNNTTNAQDYVLFRAQLGQPSVSPTYNYADLNCNVAVNSQDYVLFRGLLGSPPGPSGLVP